MQVEIRSLFYSRVADFAQQNNIRVVWPTLSPTGSDPKKENQYLRPSTLPVNPETIIKCDGGSIWTWILQVSVYRRTMVKGEQGSAEFKAMALADKMLSMLPFADKLSGSENTYQVIRQADIISPVDTSDGWIFVPVQFRVQTIR